MNVLATTDGDRRAAADDPPALLSAPLTFKEQTSATDSKLMDLLWGKDKVRSARNETVRFCVRVCGCVRVVVRSMIEWGNHQTKIQTTTVMNSSVTNGLEFLNPKLSRQPLAV